MPAHLWQKCTKTVYYDFLFFAFDAVHLHKFGLRSENSLWPFPHRNETVVGLFSSFLSLLAPKNGACPLNQVLDGRAAFNGLLRIRSSAFVAFVAWFEFTCSIIPLMKAFTILPWPFKFKVSKAMLVYSNEVDIFEVFELAELNLD